uniref:PIN domain-containing protein n=1 Tax=Glossina morsitans morsitans TaxID=37546 RepID=A0A1B0FHB7_GLOMM
LTAILPGPYQILIDATFCQAALKNKVIVEEHMRKYFQVQVKLLTTQCIILEAESLGAPLVGATQIFKKFLVHKCGHAGNPIAASECIKCIKQMVGIRIVLSRNNPGLQQHRSDSYDAVANSLL